MAPPENTSFSATRNPDRAASSDEKLACQAQAGCLSSFEQLMRRFQGPILHFLRRQGAGSDVEDLTQETFLRAYQKLHQYNRNWSFSSWLFTIARRIGINHRRTVPPESGHDVVQSVASTTPEPWRTAAAKEERLRLWEVAESVLSVDQVTALWLYYVEEMPVADVARVLERSRGSVKTMLFRARARLLPFLSEFGGEVGCAAHTGDNKKPSSGC